jgi:hypothetical protein
MISAERMIATLDRVQGEHADDPAATLNRLAGPNGAIIATATVRAWVRDYTPQQLTPLIIQGDSNVTISPTDLAASPGWPTGPAAIPRRGDQIIVQGKTRQVMAAAPLSPAGTLSRINLQCRG